MIMIVGLGNPGEEYQDTRHNLGFMVADALAREVGARALSWQSFSNGTALLAKAADVLLVKPQTYMNESGRAVAAVSEFYKIPPKDMWVVHDDIDLPLGKIRIRAGGRSGGHNGVESLIAHLKTDAFLRFRLGVGRGAHRSVVEFVLSRFQQGEAGEMRKLIKHGVDAVRLALEKGTDRAMNRFN